MSVALVSAVVRSWTRRDVYQSRIVPGNDDHGIVTGIREECARQQRRGDSCTSRPAVSPAASLTRRSVQS
jgi:hypothetical protein